jgi:hypothetical protein
MATAPKLARQLYQALKSGVVPAKVSAAAYEAARHARAMEAVKKKARWLGLMVTEGAAAAAGPPA